MGESEPLFRDSLIVEDPKALGAFVKTTREQRGLTQEDLAAASGTGRRFIIELEQGKPTCQLGLVIHALRMLGVDLEARVR